MASLFVLTVAAFLACVSVSPADAVYSALSSRTLPTVQQFNDMSLDEGVLIKGRSMKFLIDNRVPASPQVWFCNANYLVNGVRPDSAKYHYYFAKAVLPQFVDSLTTFNANTYYTQTKRYFAGTVQTYQLESGLKYAFSIYPEDVASEQVLLNMVTILKPTVTIPAIQLALVATGPQQTFATVQPAIAALGVESYTIDQILGSIQYIPMQTGECWGYLRIFPVNNDDLSPLDIPVFQELPLDLAVVAGVITKAFQDANAHVNLKSKERGTPNMVLRSASPTNAQLQPWANLPIKLVVSTAGFNITASTAAEVLAKYQARINKPWVPITWTSDTRLISNRDMCPTLASTCVTLGKAFGTKAANLGLLTSRQVLGRTTNVGSPSALRGYNLVPEGFGIPILNYHNFVKANPMLRSNITALIAAEKTGLLSPLQRKAWVTKVQSLFYTSIVPAAALRAIQLKLNTTLAGVLKIKVRSSANAEDLPNFDGAGLHDSFSANLGKVDKPDFSCKVSVSGDEGVDTKLEVKPKTLQCALKAVYASLWNKRAIEERSFARLDHATVGMGIAIVPQYDNESPVAANSVVITRVIGAENLYGFSFSIQKDNNLVTNPTPGTLAENIIAAFSDLTQPARFIVTRYSVPTPGAAQMNTTVLTIPQMNDMLSIVKAVEKGYCGAKPAYYSSQFGTCTQVSVNPAKLNSLDMEFKFLANGQWVAKQVRQFGGR